MADHRFSETRIDLFPKPQVEDVADYVLTLSEELELICEACGLLTVAAALRGVANEARRTINS